MTSKLSSFSFHCFHFHENYSGLERNNLRDSSGHFLEILENLDTSEILEMPP